MVPGACGYGRPTLQNPSLPVLRYQDVFILDFVGAKYVEVVVTTGIIKHAKFQSKQFLQAVCPPVAQPTVLKASSEWKSITFRGSAHPKLTWGLIFGH